MSPALLGIAALAALAGGLGAVLRFVLDSIVQRGTGGRFPLGVLLINVTGSLALGVLTGAADRLGGDVLTIVGTGLLGGYTTFSTAMVDSVRLLLDRRPVASSAALLGTLGLALAAAAVGIAVGAALPR